jgi:hypothetical protein
MNYYILPKNKINPNINLLFTEKSLLKPCNSKSTNYFLNNISNQVTNMIQNQNQDLNENAVEYTINLISKVVNTYEFIFSNVPGYSLSVSKVKPDSNIFFELLELFHVCNINENLKKKQMINLHVSPNANSSIYLLSILREDYNDINLNENITLLYDKFIRNRNNRSQSQIKYDFLYFESNKTDYLDIDNYTNYMIFLFYIIVKYQNNEGISIIKINNLIHKSIVDILYLLTNIFEKVMIIKPSVTNIISGERFIVCKKFMNNNSNSLSKVNLEETLYKILLNINDYSEKNLSIESVIDNEISYLFMNKIEESNVVIAQQQLEALDQIINIVKNKNKDDKIEILKRNHIQKCIQWCDKYKIPHNKFMEKLNIFLNNNNSKNSEKTVVSDCEMDYDSELL